MLRSLIVLAVIVAPVVADDPVPITITTQNDHRAMMDKLGIKSLRPGRNGMNKDHPNYANYDETKANPYPKLPDPLVTLAGLPVATADDWWKVRRPELIELFDREIYGRMPKETPKVTWEVLSTADEKVGEYDVVVKKLAGRVDNAKCKAITVTLDMTVTVPKAAAKPVPVMIEFGFVFPNRPNAAPRPAPPRPAGPTWQQQMLAKGWGYAILMPYSYQADNGAGLTRGIIGLTNKGQLRKPDEWGALRAWAWGASRALDYLETDKAVNAKQVGITGHSRFGKAALVTLAYEPRMSIGYASSSGQGGAKLHRRDWGEIVENVASSGEYHWMAGNYLKYAGPLTWDDLPIDSHELIALCAPRPCFISAGKVEGDGWVDAKGMFLAAAAAGPVYKLLGKRDLGATEFPPIDTPLVTGDIAFKQHTGGHTPGPTWPTFIEFASRYWK
jgi:hypothetical protein